VLSGEATIYRIRVEHANNYAIDVVTSSWIFRQSKYGTTDFGILLIFKFTMMYIKCIKM